MQSPPRDDGFSPLNYSEFVNDNESLHMFNIDSPAAEGMSIDPSSMVLTNDYAPSPLSNQFQSHQPANSRPSHPLSAGTPSLSFSNSPMQPRATAISSASPESSSHDSSSDSSGRRKRKSPDSSSPSATFSSYNSQNWGRNAQLDAKPRILKDSPLSADSNKHLQELDVNMQHLNSEMQNNLDFNSAASSPKGYSATPFAGSARGMRQMPRTTLNQVMPPVSSSVYVGLSG
jgi:hypothetical protein